MSDQADQLRQLVRQTLQARPELGPGVPIVVVSGGSCGVGTTTLTIQLARELARLGKRTVLVDANLTEPQLANQLNTPTHGSMAEVLAGNRSVKEVLQLVDEGMHLLAAPSSDEPSTNLNRTAVARLLTELRSLGSLADVVLVDAGHGMTPWVQNWWRAAEQVFLITTEHEATVKESYVAAKLAPWGDADGKLRLVVNQCDDRQRAEKITNRFAATCRRFLGLHVGGAPPVAPREEESSAADAQLAFCQSVRLLATEIVSHSVVVSACIANRQTNRGGRLADMIAVAEKSDDSSNNPQTVPSE
jgi:flagellar biosynthesis protein FlhG